jgi:Flp pilus assembly protein TadG
MAMILSKDSVLGRLRASSGTAAIEFAITAPMLLILLVGFVEIGFAAYQSMQVQDAVEAGAVYATQNGWNASGIATAVTSATGASGLTATPAPTQFCGCPSATGITTIICTGTCSDGTAPGQYVQVNATLARISIFPGSGLGLPANLTATSTVRTQ